MVVFIDKIEIVGKNVHRNNVTGGGQEIAQLADWDEETITTVIAAVLGIGAGLGIPIFFVTQEARDKEESRRFES